MKNEIFHETIGELAGEAPAAPINIWLVDDNRRLRNSVRDLLGTFTNIRCTGSFSSPNAVLSALASKPGPDVILLDIQMGEACGLDAIEPIKSLARSTHVVMFTSCFDGESRLRAMNSGASDFLLKRFPIEHIVDSIERAVQSPAPRPYLPRRKSCGAMPPEPTSTPAPERSSWLKRYLGLLRN